MKFGITIPNGTTDDDYISTYVTEMKNAGDDSTGWIARSGLIEIEGQDRQVYYITDSSIELYFAVGYTSSEVNLYTSVFGIHDRYLSIEVVFVEKSNGKTTTIPFEAKNYGDEMTTKAISPSIVNLDDYVVVVYVEHVGSNGSNPTVDGKKILRAVKE